MKKSDVEYSLFKFMKVLEWPVWLCIVAAYLFTSILLWLFEKFSPYSYSNNKEKFKLDPEKREFTLKECLWFCLTSLTPQGIKLFFIYICISNYYSFLFFRRW